MPANLPVRGRGLAGSFFYAAKRNDMGLNKKQKKQLDVHRTKLQKLKKLLSNAREQMDDPSEVAELEKQILEHEAAVEKLKAEA